VLGGIRVERKLAVETAVKAATAHRPEIEIVDQRITETEKTLRIVKR
jgi:hypothetical protein